MEDFLFEEFAKPPLARLLSLMPTLEADLEAVEGLKNCLDTAEYFIGLLASHEWRAEVAEAARSNDTLALASYRAARLAGKAMQRSLQDVFFSSAIRAFTEKYLVF